MKIKGYYNEANYWKSGPHKHTSYLDLKNFVNKYKGTTPKKIYITHIGESVVKNKDKIKTPFILAQDDMKITF